MEFLAQWLLIASVVFLASVSPGPDFVMTVRNSVMYGRKAGVFTAIGLGIAVLVHVLYCIVGIAAVISQSVLLFSILKFAGAAYLLYIGYKSLRSKGFEHDSGISEMTRSPGPPMSAIRALRSGFLTNLLNPKATMFFLALYTQVIGPDTALALQALYGASAVVIVPCWFVAVALFLTDRRLKSAFLRFSKWIDRLCGGFLVALGVRLALAKPAMP
ncbi:MAG: LysE family translocator [Alphaproteobacteria bacterium]|nr:LysE family translocator [Alphaproteobacteria bacterium]